MIEVPRIIDVPPQTAASIHLSIPRNEMGKHMDPAIQEILRVLSDQAQAPAGPLFAYHLRRPSEIFEFELAFPVATPFQPMGRVRMIERPAARVVRSVYTGQYERLAEAWGALQQWVRAQELNGSSRFWESYLTDPNEEPDPGRYRTELNWVLG